MRASPGIEAGLRIGVKIARLAKATRVLGDAPSRAFLGATS